MPWAPVQTYLDAQPGNFAKYQYTLGGSGNDDNIPLSKIIGGHAYRINAGTSSPVLQETSSFVVHIYQGKGYSMVGEKRLDWQKSDTFAVPHWSAVTHHAAEGETAYIFAFSDRPLMRNLGMLREKE